MYRGSILDHGLSLTQNEYPQWIVALHAEEYYDEEEKIWVDWSDRDDTDITGYFVLAGRDQKEIFHCKNIEKAVGWDGQSWKSLAELDLNEIKVQFRVEEHTYEENTTLRVAAIDHYDAEPGRTVQKLDVSEVKALDAKYASFFRKRKGEQKPIKPIGKPTIPIKSKPKVDSSEDVAPDKSDDAPPKKEKAKPKKEKSCTQAEAWKACKKAKDESISDSKLANIWLQSVETLAPDGDEDQMTPELWQRVKEVVSEQVSGDEIKF